MSEAKGMSEAKRREELDKISSNFTSLILACILLQYAASIEMKKDINFGMKILGEFEKLRDGLQKDLREYIMVFSQSEIEESRARIGFYQSIYLQSSDAALELSNKYFSLPPRPTGSEYACNDADCQKAALALARQYFPSLYETKS